MPSTQSNRTWRLLTIGAVAAFAAYRLPELTRYSLWYDEIFSITLAQMGWLEMLGAAIRDRTNPPLFYVVLKLWMAFGDSVAWLRLLPCLIGIGAAIPFMAVARRMNSLPVGIAAAAAGAASPLLVFLSNEIRAYSLLLFLSALSLLCFVRLVETIDWEAELEAEGSSPNGLGDVAPERKRRLVLLAFVNLLLVYTHYFGWLAVSAELAVGFLWYRRLIWPLALASGTVLFLFMPWVVSVVLAARGVPAPLSNVDWITSPGAGDFLLFFDALVARVLSEDLAWIGLLVLGLVALGLITRLPPRAAEGAASSLTPQAVASSPPRLSPGAFTVLAILPPLIAMVAGMVSDRPVFVPRYLVVAAPAWWLLVALGASANSALTAVFALFTLTAGALREARGGEKLQWDQVVRAVAADAGPAGGTLYSLEGFTALPAAFYAHSEGVPLQVRPVSDLRTMLPPAWLVVRKAPADTSSPLGGGLTPRDLALTPVYEASVPSYRIVVYKVSELGTRPD